MIRKEQTLCCVFVIVGLMIFGLPALSQEETIGEFEVGESEQESVDEIDSGIEEILITGGRVSHDDQSISETSFGAEDLKELRIQDISDLARFTPGLEINTAFAASNPTLFIRGIGLKDYNANAAGAVSVYVDGVTINSPAGQLFQLFDTKNVTVLKGPQSGRFGRNATAGAIIVDSNLPDGEWSSEASISYGSYNAVEVLGAIGFPIVEDKLSGRIAFSYNRRDGYTRNGCGGWDPEAHGYDENSRSVIEQYYAALDPLPDKQTVYRNNDGTGPTQQYIYANAALAKTLFERQVPAIVAASDLGGDDLYPWQANFHATKLVLSDNTEVRTPKYFDGNGNYVYTVKTNAFAPGHLDNVCVLKEPGRVYTEKHPRKEPGLFDPYPNRPIFEDFQGLKDWTNNAHDWAARGMLLFTPTDDIEVLVSLHGGQNLSDSFHMQMIPATEAVVGADCPSSDPCLSPEDIEIPFREPTSTILDNWTEGRAGEPLVEVPGLLQKGSSSETGFRGANPYLGFYDRDGKELLDVWGLGVNARWDLPAFSLHSVSGYEGNQRLVEDEGDATPFLATAADWSDTAWQVSQEFRIESEGDDYRWLAGAFALYEDLEAENRFPAALSRNWTQTFDQSLEGYSIFASGHYDIINDRNSLPFVEQLTLSSSLAWRRESKEFLLDSKVEVNGIVAEVIDLDCPAGAGKCPKTAVWEGVTGDVMLSWMPLALDEYEMTLHLKYSRGMKNGHFNAGLTTNPKPNNPVQQELRQALDPVLPENIHAVEFGFDSSWAGKAVILSAAFYRYWYEDLQIFDLVNEEGSLPTQLLLNAPANVYGIEADLEINPMDELILGFGFNWLDSTFGNFVVGKRQAVGGAQGGSQGRENLKFDYSGNATIAAPEFTLNGSVEYSYYIPDWGSISPRIDYSYQSQVFLDPQGLELISMPAYWYMDLYVSYLTENQDIEVAFWISNVTDQQYLVDVFDLSRQYDRILQAWGEPRMFGMTVSIAY